MNILANLLEGSLIPNALDKLPKSVISQIFEACFEKEDFYSLAHTCTKMRFIAVYMKSDRFLSYLSAIQCHLKDSLQSRAIDKLRQNYHSIQTKAKNVLENRVEQSLKSQQRYLTFLESSREMVVQQLALPLILHTLKVEDVVSIATLPGFENVQYPLLGLYDREEALIAYLQESLTLENYEMHLSLFSRLADSKTRSVVIEKISTWLLEKEKYAEATQAAKGIDDYKQHDATLITIANRLISLGQTEEGAKVLELAHQAVVAKTTASLMRKLASLDQQYSFEVVLPPS